MITGFTFPLYASGLKKRRAECFAGEHIRHRPVCRSSSANNNNEVLNFIRGIAAMSAKGTSTIHNIDQIDRGYEHIETRLNAIGARITRN